MDHLQEEKLKNLQISLQFKEASLNSLREVLATNLFHLPHSAASLTVACCCGHSRILQIATWLYSCKHACTHVDTNVSVWEFGAQKKNVESAM